MTCCVLVVEDDTLIAMDIEAILQHAGFIVLGPVPSEFGALELIKSNRPDIALLDIHIADGNAFGIADRLAAKKIPFAFLTGHSADFLPAAHSTRPLLSKPYKPDGLVQKLRSLVA
jgi:CheY-like chemotaxis protein